MEETTLDDMIAEFQEIKNIQSWKT
jgi:hypothetical protein